MLNLFWRGVARVVAKPAVADYLIRRAIKTPFSHLPSNDDPSYMERYWLFNPYPVSSKDRKRWQFPWSIRLHHIKREDQDRALHDHPWNARTIILKGGYQEKRLLSNDDPATKAAVGAIIDHPEMSSFDWSKAESTEHFNRIPGDTATLRHNEYHQITHVLEGTWTMFITGPWLGDWGFLVDGKKIWWRTYLGENADGTKVDPLASKTLGPLNPAFFQGDEIEPGELVSLMQPRIKRTDWKQLSQKEIEMIRQHDRDLATKAGQIRIDNVQASFPRFAQVDAGSPGGVRFVEPDYLDGLIATDAPVPGSKEWADNLHEAILATTQRYQCREIGEGDWRDCSKTEYESHFTHPEMDTRIVTGAQQ